MDYFWPVLQLYTYGFAKQKDVTDEKPASKLCVDSAWIITQKNMGQ